LACAEGGLGPHGYCPLVSVCLLLLLLLLLHSMAGPQCVAWHWVS